MTSMNIFTFLFPDMETFWTAIAAMSTVAAVVIALKPVMERERLGKALFSSAVVVHVYRDGVFQIENVFEEPIIIKSILQRLYRSSELKFKTDGDNKIIIDRIKKKPRRNFKTDKIEKILAPKQSFIYADTKTHLPERMESEDVWIVETVIIYQSMDKNINKLNYTHRFSHKYEPTFRWV